MERTIEDVGTDWDNSMFGLHVNRKIRYSSEMDSKFVRGKFSYGGYCEGTIIKSLTSDLDDTATQDRKRQNEYHFNLTNWLVEGLSESNKLLRRIREKLHNDIFSLPKLETKTEVKDTLKSFYGDIARCKIHRSEFLQAAEYAADNVELVNSYDKLIEKSDGMGYMVNFLTGSPLECGFYLVKKRLKLPTAFVGRSGQIYDRIFGSIFKFDYYTGYYTGETISGVDEKPKRMKEIHKATGCGDDLSIFLSDDQLSDGKAASMAGFAIWVDVKGIFQKIGLSTGLYNLPGKHSIYCPEARNDMSIVIELMKMFNRYKTAVFIMSPESELELYNLAVTLKESYKNALKAKYDFFFHRDTFLRCANQIVTIVDPIVTERSLNVSDSLSELKSSNNIERDKSLMSNTISNFENRMPEFKAPKSFGAGLKNIVKEKQLFRPEEWWLRWKTT